MAEGFHERDCLEFSRSREPLISGFEDALTERMKQQPSVVSFRLLSGDIFMKRKQRSQ